MFVSRILIPRDIKIIPPIVFDIEEYLLPIFDPNIHPIYVVMNVILKFKIDDKIILRFKRA